MPRTAAPRRAAGVSRQAPVAELGTILQGVFSYDGMAPWRNFVDDTEYVPELIWPRSISTYEQVRSDSQVGALYKGTTLPLRKRGNWAIDPNGVDDNARVERLSSTLNIPIQGEEMKPRGRMQRRFIFSEHLRLALLALIHGHRFFEQVGEIDKDGLWSLRKLADRPPKTIADFRISPEGSLISIIQNVSSNPLGIPAARINPFGPFPEIPIDNLVGYVWDKEGANWAGRSMLRDIYKNWLLKDREMRIDAINHERAGGVPYIEGHPEASNAELAKLNQAASAFRVGDLSGMAVPYGAKVNIARAGNSDVVASMKYHDECMARNFLLMVLQLGATRSGSRNLGSTFVEFFSEGVNSIGDWFCDNFNAFVIEDYWDWNYGVDEDHVPKLVYTADPELNATDISNLIKVGAVVVDDDLEDALRQEYGLPNRGTPRHNQALLPTDMPDPGETPDGSSSPASKDTPGAGQTGNEQISQDEKQTQKAQSGGK